MQALGMVFDKIESVINLRQKTEIKEQEEESNSNASCDLIYTDCKV